MIGGWHMEVEIISAVIVLVLLISSKDVNMIPSFKNIIFRWCLWFFFVAICLNILSTILISTGEHLVLTNIITTMYYMVTPLMTAAYFLYALCVLLPNIKNNYVKIFLITLILYFVYAGFVLTNFFNGFIYVYDGTYTVGPLNFITYIVAYIYALAAVIITICIKKHSTSYERQVLAVFPLVGVCAVCIQMLIPEYTLSGFGAAISALILYLYLQNKQRDLDGLTRLSNLNIFFNLLKYKISKDEDFVAVLIAVADFKYINDKFDTKVGDELLLAIANYLKKTVGQKQVFRNNGAKFCLLLDNNKDIDVLLNSLAERFKQPWMVGEYNLSLRIGISYAINSKLSTKAEDMLSVLEYAVAISKYKSVSAYEECNQDMLNNIANKHYVLELLKEELDHKGFEVYYQPLMSTKTNTFVSAEALIRLYDRKTQKMVYPDDFIPVAEESGLIIDIGYLVLEKVCIFLRNMLNNDQKIDCISVNVSVMQFMQTDLSEKIIDIIDKYNVPHSMIKLELTESALALSYKTLHDTIIKLSDANIKFALDDFGTGFSNISYFIGLPFDFVKIDKSLVWSSITDHRMANLIRHIIIAFTQIGLRVIVEGVETIEQDAFVRECGCELIQGYYYARPMPADEAYLALICNNSTSPF